MLIYDSLIGQKNSKIFFEFSRSGGNKTVSYPGRYLNGSVYKQNIEQSARNIQDFYDTDVLKATTNEYKKSLELLGYNDQPSLLLKQNLDKSRFGFWQGFVKHKGTNYSIDAFANSVQYKNIEVDEYWAYRVASYGDARVNRSCDLKIYHSDTFTDKTRYVFLEPDDRFVIDGNITGNYDIPDYSRLGYDTPLWLSSMNQNCVYEWFDARGSWPIKHNSESRWRDYDDLNEFQWFAARDRGSRIVKITKNNQIIQIFNGTTPIRADVFELLDISGLAPDQIKKSQFNSGFADDVANFTYREAGEFQATSQYFKNPSFIKLNHSTIKITNPDLIGKTMLVRWYEPDHLRYGPLKIIDQINKTVVTDDIIFWDPARGVHNQRALEQIDIIKTTDPARYNTIKNNTESVNNEVYDHWGENEVGRVWWNTTNLVWQPYSDVMIYPELNERIARWGAIADYSSIDIYQWYESSHEPGQVADSVDFQTAPEPAMKKLLSRQRAWFVRPVVYLYSTNPQIATPDVHRGLGSLRLSATAVGDIDVIFENGRLAENNPVENNQLSIVQFVPGANKLIDKNFKPLAIVNHTGIEKFKCGSTMDDNNPLFISTVEYRDFMVDLNSARLIDLEQSAGGRFVLSMETNASGDQFLKMTCVKNNHSELVRIVDTPVQRGTRIQYLFERWGLTVSCVNNFAHDDIWPGNLNTNYRKSSIAHAMGNPSHEIVIRSCISGRLLMQTTQQWSGCDQPGDTGWVSTVIPEFRDVFNDFESPHNHYDVRAGDYTPVSNIAYLNSDIIADQLLFKNNTEYVKSYHYRFDEFEELVDTIIDYYYNDYNISVNNFCSQSLIVDLTIPDERIELFLNDLKLNKNQYTIVYFNSIKRLIVAPSTVVLTGSKFTIRIKKIAPNEQQLAFDPGVNETPTTLIQYRYSHDYTKKTTHDKNGNLSTRYYYWIKNIDYSTRDKQLSIKQITDLLLYNRSSYGIMQVLKHYNQYDGRPNRYGMMIINEMSRHASVSNRFTLRINNNPHLKTDDQDMNLKNVHAEWALICRSQTTRIPDLLWSRLTDSLCRSTPVGSLLPIASRQLYDTRNQIKSSYGLGDNQLFANVGLLKETIIHTIRNTRLKTNTGISDIINIDMAKLETVLSTEYTTRQFMNQLWSTAKPNQVNEIFFNCLNDALVQNTELSDIFKTSIITIQNLTLNV